MHECVLKDLLISQIRIYLRTLFQHIERRHDQVVEETGDTTTQCKGYRLDVFIKLQDIRLVEFVNCEKYGMRRAAAKLDH